MRHEQLSSGFRDKSEDEVMQGTQHLFVSGLLTEEARRRRGSGRGKPIVTATQRGLLRCVAVRIGEGTRRRLASECHGYSHGFPGFLYA